MAIVLFTESVIPVSIYVWWARNELPAVFLISLRHFIALRRHSFASGVYTNDARFRHRGSIPIPRDFLAFTSHGFYVLR